KDTGRITATGKVQTEAATKDTGRSGKVQAEISAKSTGKVQSQPPIEGGGGQVQAEAHSRDTGKVTGQLPIDPPAKSVSRPPDPAPDPVPARPPAADPTQTYVRGQHPDAPAPAAAVEQVPYLNAVAGIDGAKKMFRLSERDHVYMFGRTRRCEFRVDTAEVSREHASFTRRADGIFVNDLGSVNGVLVNNTRVKEYRLYHGDLIQIGHIKLRLFDPNEPSPRDSAADRS